MFDVEYLYKFCKWIAAMEQDDERCLDRMKPSKDIGNEIHPHYNQVFQRIDCSLSEDIWCATSRRFGVEIRWCQRNLEKILHILSSAIENANPWRPLKTARLELYLYISFMFDVKYLYKFSAVYLGSGAKRRPFFGALQRHREWNSSSLQSGVSITWLLSIGRDLTRHEQ